MSILSRVDSKWAYLPAYFYSHLAPESLIAAIWSLRSLAEARTSGRSRDFLGGSSQSRADFSGRPLSPAYDEAQQPYDPACVFDLEVMISLASKSPEHIAETWYVEARDAVYVWL